MKKLLLLIFIFVFFCKLQSQVVEEEKSYYPQPVEAQPCMYSSYTLNGNGNIENLQTEAVMVEQWITPIKGRVIDFTLLKVEQDVILLVEIHKDAEGKLQPQCFGSKTIIEFSLKNGETVKLSQYGPKQCGYINTADEDVPYYNITNFAYFLISDNAAKKLLSSEVNFCQINAANYELKFVMASEIYDEINEMTIYPELYFLSELDCLLNPKLSSTIKQNKEE